MLRAPGNGVRPQIVSALFRAHAIILKKKSSADIESRREKSFSILFYLSFF